MRVFQHSWLPCTKLENGSSSTRIDLLEANDRKNICGPEIPGGLLLFCEKSGLYRLFESFSGIHGKHIQSPKAENLSIWLQFIHSTSTFWYLLLAIYLNTLQDSKDSFVAKNHEKGRTSEPPKSLSLVSRGIECHLHIWHRDVRRGKRTFENIHPILLHSDLSRPAKDCIKPRITNVHLHWLGVCISMDFWAQTFRLHTPSLPSAKTAPKQCIYIYKSLAKTPGGNHAKIC